MDDKSGLLRKFKRSKLGEGRFAINFDRASAAVGGASCVKGQLGKPYASKAWLTKFRGPSYTGLDGY